MSSPLSHLLTCPPATEAGLPPVLLGAIDPWIFSFSAVTVIVTIWMGFWAAKKSKTASDFFVAGRSVSVGWNASAISGEYLSAASFMGVAGMVMAVGYDALWYPVCYACGYLFLLLFIAGPLRRFGAYTVPDLAEGRFDSPVFRKIAVVFVLFIGFFYTMPQMKGAGTTLAYIFPGLPYWVGVALVGAVITLNVALGGMKGITLVQAFQYWLKMFAISVPVFVLMAAYGHYGKQVWVNGDLVEHREPSLPVRVEATFQTIAERVGSGNLTTSGLAQDIEYKSQVGQEFQEVGTILERDFGDHRKALPDNAPKDQTWLSPFGPLTTKAATKAGLSPQDAKPLSLLYTYSLIIALVCGTAGLPHILVRFYTNPDGVAAKRTTMWVMILIGVFYVFPPVFGVMGRNLMPELYAAVGAKGTDKIVLELPRMLNEKVPMLGSIMSGITCAGAFAAFMSTFSGLLVSMTGAMAHDVYGRMLNPKATAEQRLKAFKVAAVVIGGIAILLGTQVELLDINFMVGQAFAIAAASYFPFLFMCAWWRKLTMKGAATGMLTGGLLALGGITLTSISDIALKTSVAKGTPNALQGLDEFWIAHPAVRILCEQPALWAVPLAIVLMIIVSKLTAKEVPSDIRMKMLVLHAPEKLGLKQEYIQEHQPGH
jgi:cation/acetate symporter